MHYLLMEVIKLGSVQGFCHVISYHLICQTIFDVNVAFGFWSVMDVQMKRALASTLASISFEQHGALVVLIEDILLDGISLCLEE